MTGKRRAIWTAVAFVLACVVSIATIWVARRAVGADIDQLAEQAVEMALAQRPAGSNDEQARQQMMPFMRGMISLYPIIVPVGVLMSTIVISTVLFGAYRVAGVGVRWPMTFAAAATGAAAAALARLIVIVIIVFVVQKSIPAESFLDNSIVPLHLAAFLPSDISPVWRSAAAKIDLLQFVFVLALISYLVDEEGFARDARKIVVATVLCYAAWIVLGMAWAAAWSGFGR